MILREIDIEQTSMKPHKMTFTKLLPDDRRKEVLEHVINNISCYEKPSPLMEALVNDAQEPRTYLIYTDSSR
jgi:hypothetical protein